MAAIIFDLDGTLVDSVPDIHAAVNQTLADLGKPALDTATVTSFVGNGVPALAERLHAHAELSEPVAKVEARFRAHYDADPSSRTRLYPGVLEALDSLAAQGHKLGVCTNKPEAPARAILAALGVEARFHAVVGGDSLPTRKPDPAPLHATHAALGGGPVVYVGDSEVDAAAAHAAKMPFALFTLGYRKTPVAELPHDLSFDAFTDLTELTARLLAATA